MSLSRGQRYLLATLIFFVIWGSAYVTLVGQQADPTRDTADALLQEAQPISALDTLIVDDTRALPGKLVFVEQRAYPHYQIEQLDFATQSLQPVFEIPSGALVYQIARSPQPHSLLITYSPPATTDKAPYDRNGVYLLDLQDGMLTRLLGEDAADVYYAYPQWSGNAIIYAIYKRGDESKRVERYNTDTGVVSVIAENATLPVISPDGASIATLHINPTTQARSLWIADADGQSPNELVSETAFADVDVPVFSPDGNWIYFTVINPNPAKNVALSILTGALPTLAHGNHNKPALWYRVAVGGGAPEVVTQDPVITLYGALYDQTIGFVSDTGFQIARGQVIEQVVRSRVMRSFVWLSE